MITHNSTAEAIERHSSLDSQKNKPWLTPDRAKKIDRVWDAFINISAIAALSVAGLALAPLTITFLGGCALYSYHKHKGLQNDIDQARIQALQKFALPQAEGLKAAPGLDKNFTNKVFHLRDRISALKPGELDAFRAELNSLLNHPLYDQFMNTDHPMIDFLQTVALNLISGDGRPALEAYGQRFMNLEAGQKHPAGVLAKKMDTYLNQMSFHRDNLVATIVWGLTHPLATVHGAISNFFPLHYNSHKDNPSFIGYIFEMDGKEIYFNYGPGLTGDSVYQKGILPLLEKKGWKVVHNNHQDLSHGSEAKRIVEAFKWTEKQNSPLLHPIFGFDTKMKNFAHHVSVTDPEDFFDKYIDFVKEDYRIPPAGENETETPAVKKNGSGMYIPEDLLDDDEADKAFTAARIFFSALSQNNDRWNAMLQDETGKERLAKMLMLGTDAFLSLAILYKHKPEFHSGACKQDIDRGPMENVAEQMLFELMKSGDGFTTEQMHQWGGAIAGRARLADGRTPMYKRFQVLYDFLQLINGQEKTAHDVLVSFKEELTK